MCFSEPHPSSTLMLQRSTSTQSKLDYAIAKVKEDAVLLVKLRVFDSDLLAQRHTGGNLQFDDPRRRPASAVPVIPYGFASAWAQSSVLVRSTAERERMIALLRAAEAPTAIYYTKPLHLRPALAYLGHSPRDCPISENVSSRIFSLPMHPYLDEPTIERVLVPLKRAL